MEECLNMYIKLKAFTYLFGIYFFCLLYVFFVDIKNLGLCSVIDNFSVEQSLSKLFTADTLKTDAGFWAVLGIRGCREKLQTAISMLILRTVFLCFHGQNNLKNFM